MTFTHRLHPTLLIPTLLLLTAIGACGGGSSASGRLTLSLTDAPVDTADAVVIHFTAIVVQRDNGGPRSEYSLTDPVTHQPGRSIDLLQLNSGKSTVLFDRSLPAGSYSWIRLAVDFDPQKTYIEIGGLRYALSCVSCEQNGLKLNRSFSLDGNGPLSLTLDFDLRKSITDPNSNHDYKLRPTIRIVETAPAGIITGAVSESLMTPLGGCSVYVYEGMNVIPGDIYLPLDGTTPTGARTPVTTAPVIYDSDTATYTYRAAYLPAGAYTIALTCDGEEDNPLQADTGVTFYGTDNVNVTPGEITNFNFNMPPPA